MREVAASAVLPRFQRLTEDEIQYKGPADPVTAADREAEALLTAGLIALRPGARVVGEEAVAADPSLMSFISEPGDVWVVDPLDGTANFASGTQPFAVMVALMRDGEPVASWILDPVGGIAAVAERGGGAFLGGVRATVPTGHRAAHELRGWSSTNYIPADLRAGVQSASGAVGEMLPGHNCAGYEYPAIVRDEQHFAFFWRTLPWDHVPGVLFVEEAGGVAWRLDGTQYLAADHERAGLLVAQNQDVWDSVRTTLLADVPD